MLIDVMMCVLENIRRNSPRLWVRPSKKLAICCDADGGLSGPGVVTASNKGASTTYRYRIQRGGGRKPHSVNRGYVRDRRAATEHCGGSRPSASMSAKKVGFSLSAFRRDGVDSGHRCLRNCCHHQSGSGLYPIKEGRALA